MRIASETQAEPTRRRRGELLFWVLVAKAAFAASTQNSSGGGPTDTDSAAIIGCDGMRWICVHLRDLRATLR